jgi:hypothetical protein
MNVAAPGAKTLEQGRVAGGSSAVAWRGRGRYEGLLAGAAGLLARGRLLPKHRTRWGKWRAAGCTTARPSSMCRSDHRGAIWAEVARCV